MKLNYWSHTQKTNCHIISPEGHDLTYAPLRYSLSLIVPSISGFLYQTTSGVLLILMRWKFLSSHGQSQCANAISAETNFSSRILLMLFLILFITFYPFPLLSFLPFLSLSLLPHFVLYLVLYHCYFSSVKIALS